MDAMAFHRCADYQALSEKASECLIRAITQNPQATICLATGGTPLLTYSMFVSKVKQRNIDISQITFVKLDEWLNIPLNADGTCETFLQTHIIQPLNIAPERFISFRSQNVDDKECQRVIELITQNGGIDLCVLGLGKNGHLGLNEPGDSLEPACHITMLDEHTRQHAMIKDSEQPVERGITLGLREIMAAREILFLVAGEWKQSAFSKLLEKKVSCQTPSSFLWMHQNVHCLYDSTRFTQELEN
ncbi:galactosamine-6-phosphate isomerase [Buttiauxella sp. S04-F03]|uniref:galactosamine-6-phosphate isomerase n=1 Tax=Buttiauxella sp. S04-F03 TaxID=2904525 RepID=UPI001E5C012D|nr:galactosamine-6-phosphate isomerase [Buttiauxella sp. S04-F03]MCE0813506.1 galactosamine-6-phosphate isomerase [Buttiauxella sp. S04-F03]